MNRDADLFFVLARLRFDGESNCCFGIFDLVVDDWVSFIAERVAGLSLFQFDASDNVSRVRFVNLVQLFALRRVQRAQTFRSSSG